MGEIYLYTREQEIILDEIKKSEFLQSQFYYTGGTALSAVYLQHRYSDDLDFFSEKKFNNQVLFTLVEEWSRKHHFTFESRFVEVVYIFNLLFSDKENLKVDFSYYPYEKIEKEQIIDGIKVDSLIDIAVNKMLTISQRTEVKDFVDLYFLLEQFSIWDLLHGVNIKFRMEIEPIFAAANCLKVEDFTTLPRMLKPLTLEQLQSFFRKQAETLGRQTTIE